VEFAVVAPVFFLLVFGMIEFGRMIMVQQVITNASREGGRRAVLEGATRTNVLSTVNSYLTSGQVAGNSLRVSIDPNPATATEGTPITVTVNVSFSDVSWLPTPVFLSGRELRATSTMRRESSY